MTGVQTCALPIFRKRILFTFGLLAVYRIGSHIPTPGVNTAAVEQYAEQAANTMFGLYDMFSGKNLSQMTIFALGVMPYISASIILQLLTVVIPHLEKLSKEGELEKVVAVNSEKTMTVKLGFSEGKTQIELTGKPYKLPFTGDMEFKSFSGTGTLAANELIFSEFDAGAAEGTLTGNARLRWGANWSLEGELNAKGLDAGKVASLLVSSGRLDGKGGYTMRAPSPDKLIPSLRVEGSFSVQKGTLGGVDLTRVLQGESISGGNTLFSEMNGSVLYDGGKVQARQVRLAAGLLNASGAVTMDAQKNLSGSMQMELKAASTQIRASLTLGGTLTEPAFKR